jgi:TetR/AcrR family transcriptional regulator, transcriptional repressor for nem operon
MPLYKTTPEDIIKKSISVFRTNGYYRTTMNDLAQATGLTKGVFYHHFTNKEEVMKKSLQATSLWFEKKIFSIAYDDTLSPKKRLVKMADVLFSAFTQHTGGCFFANTILETAHVEDTFLIEIDDFFTLFENALSNIYKKKYKGEALKDLTQQIIADIEGTIIIMQVKKDQTLLNKAFERAIKKL